MYFKIHSCGRLCTGLYSVKNIRRPALKLGLGLDLGLYHRLCIGAYWQQWRCMTITSYKKRRRMLFSSGIPRDQFDNSTKSREFVKELNPNERQLLFTELNTILSQKQNGEILKGKPTKIQLRQVSFSHAIPFIGFGFLDNAIMIMAGDYIDLKIGIALGISTMAAAGFGNLISDLAGLGLAGYVEALVVRLGIPVADLTAEQLDMWSTRWAAFIGRSLGIIIGCLLGMFPLFFLETRHKEDKDG